MNLYFIVGFLNPGCVQSGSLISAYGDGKISTRVPNEVFYWTKVSATHHSRFPLTLCGNANYNTN